MSTILEALKKSEKERKLNNLPTLSDMPPPQERSSISVLLLATICVLLLLIIAVLGLQWWTSQNRTADEAVTPRVERVEPVTVAQPEEMQDTNDMVVNVVSYSDDSAQSFAMIDGKMVRENDFVRAGLQVEKIEQNAVILNMRGKRIRRTP